MNQDQIDAMLKDLANDFNTNEKSISGPLAIALYHDSESIINEHIDAANRNKPIPTPG